MDASAAAASTAAPTRSAPAGSHRRPELARAGCGVRVAAALIDAALLLPMYHAARWAAQAWLHKSGVWSSIMLGSVLVLAYTSLEFWKTATPGKALLRLSIRDIGAAPAPRARRLARWTLKYGGRLCGVIDAATSVIVVRRAAEWLGLAVFRSEPIHFVTLRYIGELLILFSIVGFFFALGPARLALYDRLTRTAVYRRPPGVGRHGFEPLMVLPVGSQEEVIEPRSHGATEVGVTPSSATPRRTPCS
jgi:hypothetical protein